MPLRRNRAHQTRAKPKHAAEEQLILSGCGSNGYDIALVQRLLQHSSTATTQRYIGIEPQRIEQAIESYARLM